MENIQSSLEQSAIQITVIRPSSLYWFTPKKKKEIKVRIEIVTFYFLGGHFKVNYSKYS